MSAKPTNPDFENTISEDTAKKWTAAWRSTYSDKKNPKYKDLPKAFLMPVVDFIEILNELGVLDNKTALEAQKIATASDIRLRGYLGIDETNNNENKMIFVGTKEVGGVYRDIINGKIDGKGEVVTSYLSVKQVGEPPVVLPPSSGIYDFTEPCPNTCDFESPLNDDNK